MNDEEEKQPDYEEIVNQAFDFPTFREDAEEQNKLNFELAKSNLHRALANNKKVSEADYNVLKENNYPVDDAIHGGNTAAPGVELGIGLGAVALAKPALLTAGIPMAANLIKKYPMKSLEVGLTGLGASDYLDNPQDLVLETLGMKTDTMFTGGKMPSPFNPIATKKLVEIFTEIFDGPNPKFATEGGEVPNTFFMSKSDDATGGISKKGFSPNITKKNLELFNQIGWTNTAKLDIQDMLYGIDDAGKPLMSQYKRRVLKAGIGDETFNWSAFTTNRDAVVTDFLDGLQDLKIDPKTIHGHHISALRITSSLFDGLSPIQRKKLIKIFQREGLQLGNHPDNLMALHKSTHLDVVHPFLERQIGKYGQLLMDPAKIKKMTPKQREGLVKKFAKIIKRSEEIAMENTRTWLDDAFEGLSPEAAFDARMDMLNKAFDDDIAFREQLLKSVKSEQPLLPYQAEDVEIPVTPKTKKKRVTSKATKFKNLLKRIKTENPDTKQMTIWDISEEALDAYRKLF